MARYYRGLKEFYDVSNEVEEFIGEAMQRDKVLTYAQVNRMRNPIRMKGDRYEFDPSLVRKKRRKSSNVKS